MNGYVRASLPAQPLAGAAAVTSLPPDAPHPSCTITGDGEGGVSSAHEASPSPRVSGTPVSREGQLAAEECLPEQDELLQLAALSGLEPAAIRSGLASAKRAAEKQRLRREAAASPPAAGGRGLTIRRHLFGDGPADTGDNELPPPVPQDGANEPSSSGPGPAARATPAIRIAAPSPEPLPPDAASTPGTRKGPYQRPVATGRAAPAGGSPSSAAISPRGTPTLSESYTPPGCAEAMPPPPSAASLTSSPPQSPHTPAQDPRTPSTVASDSEAESPAVGSSIPQALSPAPDAAQTCGSPAPDSAARGVEKAAAAAARAALPGEAPAQREQGGGRAAGSGRLASSEPWLHSTPMPAEEAVDGERVEQEPTPGRHAGLVPGSETAQDSDVSPPWPAGPKVPGGASMRHPVAAAQPCDGEGPPAAAAAAAGPLPIPQSGQVAPGHGADPPAGRLPPEPRPPPGEDKTEGSPSAAEGLGSEMQSEGHPGAGPQHHGGSDRGGAFPLNGPALLQKRGPRPASLHRAAAALTEPDAAGQLARRGGAVAEEAAAPPEREGRGGGRAAADSLGGGNVRPRASETPAAEPMVAVPSGQAPEDFAAGDGQGGGLPTSTGPEDRRSATQAAAPVAAADRAEGHLLQDSGPEDRHGTAAAGGGPMPAPQAAPAGMNGVGSSGGRVGGEKAELAREGPVLPAEGRAPAGVGRLPPGSASSLAGEARAAAALPMQAATDRAGSFSFVHGTGGAEAEDHTAKFGPIKGSGRGEDAHKGQAAGTQREQSNVPSVEYAHPGAGAAKASANGAPGVELLANGARTAGGGAIDGAAPVASRAPAAKPPRSGPPSQAAKSRGLLACCTAQPATSD